MSTSFLSSSLGATPVAVSSSPIHVLIADEDPMGCQLLKAALERSRFRFAVVACATSCSEIVESVRAHTVDIAVVSEGLQDGTFAGFHALRQLQTSFADVRVIMLLKSAARDLVVDAFRAGAKGVVCRIDPIRVLCKGIQTVHKGQVWASNGQLQFVLEALMSSTPLRVLHSKGRCLLAHREDEIANFVAEGMTTREIAEKLGVSEHAASNCLLRIYKKLGISSRVELALYLFNQELPKS